MVIILVGRMASGKSTLAKMLEQKGYDRIITYTTRPPRPNEKNGVDYHFISDDEFIKLKDEEFFAETKKFTVDGGATWYYGSSKESYKENSIIVLEKTGLEQILDTDIDITSIYLKIKTIDSFKMAIKRSDNVDEVRRRVYADTKDFNGIEELCDFVVDNSGFKYSLDKMLEIITNLIEKGVTAL